MGTLLDRFNREFEEFTPGPEAMAQRVTDTHCRKATRLCCWRKSPNRISLVLRLRKALWTQGLECYLAELYVVPERRRHGLGRAIMLAALEAAKGRGADYIDLGTDQGDHAAHALYRSLGFRNAGPGGESAMCSSGTFEVRDHRRGRRAQGPGVLLQARAHDQRPGSTTRARLYYRDPELPRRTAARDERSGLPPIKFCKLET